MRVATRASSAAAEAPACGYTRVQCQPLYRRRRNLLEAANRGEKQQQQYQGVEADVNATTSAAPAADPPAASSEDSARLVSSFLKA
jgi:hypothetical protein